MKNLKWIVLAFLASTVSFATYVVQNGSVSQIKLSQRPTGTTVGIGGVATSSSSSTFSLTGTETLVTNQTLVITTNGRPVSIHVEDITGSGLAVQSPGSSQISVANLRLKRNGTTIGTIVCGITPASTASAVTVNCSENLSFIDQPTAGTYTYTLTEQLSGASGGSTATSSNIWMVIYEI